MKRENIRSRTSYYKDSEVTKILVKSKQGFITQEMLDKCINDYIDLLPVPDYLYSKVQTFNGLIRYIYNNLISRILPNSYRHDYKLLDDIFRNIYLPLCNAYSFTPNILFTFGPEFIILCTLL